MLLTTDNKRFDNVVVDREMLRDLFAAFALAAIVAADGPGAGRMFAAAAAYEFSDAMLAQREQESK